MSYKTKEQILEGLSLQKQKYLEGKVKGKSGYQAAIAAGYSDSTARNPGQIETPDVKAAFAELMRDRIPADRIISRLKQGLNAKKTTFFTSNGKVTDSRQTIDYKERRESATITAQIAGYWTPKQEIDHTQKLDEVTARRLIDLSVKLGIEELPFEQRKALRNSHVTLELQEITSEDSEVSLDSQAIEGS